MAIKISRNDAGNCINFIGSSNPTYWNAVLEGEVSERDTNLVNVINSVRTVESDNTVYEFFEIPYTEFADKQGNAFEDASECAQYITDNANVSGNQGSFIFSEVDTLDAVRDTTNTTVLFSNGDIFAVNSLQAIAADNGTITIRTVRGDKDVYSALRFYNTTVSNGTVVMQNLSTAVDRMNEVLSGAAIGSDGGSTAGEIAVAPESTNTFTVYGSRIVESGTAGYTSTAETGNFDTSNGIYSNQLISEPGEYFEFEQTGGWSTTGNGLTFGLFDDTMYDVSVLNDDVAGNKVKAALRLRMNSTPFIFADPENDYLKFNEAGFVNSPQAKTKFRVGLDADNRGYISQDVGNDIFELVGRTQLPLPTGNEFRLIAIFPLANELDDIRDFTTNLIDSSPALTWHYIESPDGVFHYPLFTDATQANYVDEEYGTAAPGAGTSHQELFLDEQPSQNIWYMPDTYAFEDESSAPGPLSGVVWNEILTGDDANYVPSSYGPASFTVDENTSVNFPIVPAGDADTYSVTNIPTGLLFNGTNIVGTAPEVAGDNVTNPSDVFTITVVRGNDYGSSTGTLTVTINNTTAPATAISGFTWINTSTPLVDSDTMGEGSAITMDDSVANQQRFIITKEWLETNVLPNLTDIGDKFYIGVAASGADWSSVGDADFDFFMKWERTTSNGIQSTLSGDTDNVLTLNSLTDAYYDFAVEVDGTDVGLIGCNFDDINDQPSIGNGGTFSRSSTVASYAGTIPLTIVMATVSAEAGISETDLSEITIPTVPSSLTSWTKAVDFTGGSEYLKSNNNSRSVLPIKMNDQAVLVPENTTDSAKTSDNVNSRPWATAVVFNIDNVSQNQHIWNQGQPPSQGHNNIYLRLSSSKELIFGWGREVSGYNECTIGTLGHTDWYGVYIGHKGTRLNGTDATAANLADAFDIRIMNSGGNNWTMGSNLSISAAWTSTGYRMDRSIMGDFTVGGRWNNRNFNGEVASMVVTTLRTNDDMPTSAEIEMMLKDPTGWVANYKVGGLFRHCTTDYSDYNWDTNGSNYFATQVYLMGDGINDGFSNGIRNQINNTDGYTKLVFNNMASNDIETVNINGLT